MKGSWYMTQGIDKEAEILLIKAAEDATVAQLPGIPDGPFGFHVQQAVEKLLKALLCQLAVKYKFTHDLDYLVRLLQSHGETFPKSPVDFTDLERYGVAYRYDAVPEAKSWTALLRLRVFAFCASTLPPASPPSPRLLSPLRYNSLQAPAAPWNPIPGVARRIRVLCLHKLYLKR